MRKMTALFSVMIFILSAGCKKSGDSGNDVAVAKKYAKYKVAVYKEKDLKAWMATLEKAEDVSLLEEQKVGEDPSKLKDISKVKLADDSVGYIESRHLADAPVVFTSDTKAYIRPSSGSSVYGIIPKGEVGFIIGEKGLWVQIYVGQVNGVNGVNGKNITQHWVENGFSNDVKLVQEAKEYAAAVINMNDTDANKASQAKASLESIAEGTSFIAEMAKEKLGLSKSYEPKNEEEPIPGD